MGHLSHRGYSRTGTRHIGKNLKAKKNKRCSLWNRAAFALILLLNIVPVLKAGNLSITFDFGPYRIINLQDGQQFIKLEGFGNLLVPGKPMLPSKGFMVALPVSNRIVRA